MYRQPKNVQPIVFSSFCKGQVPIIDKKFIVPSRPFRFSGFANINIQPSITIDVNKSDASGPHIGAGYPSRLGDVFKPPLSFVEIQFVGDQIAGKKNILKSIVVDVTKCYPTAIIKISVGIWVKRFGIRQGVFERNTTLVCYRNKPLVFI